MQNQLAQVAFGKQTGKGTPQASPAYQHGLVGGPIYGVDIEQAVDPQTSATRQQTNAVRDSVVPVIDYKTRCHKASIGLYLLGLFGSVSTSGSSDYTHVFTPGTSLPYFTVAGQRNAAERGKVSDVIMNEGELSWEGNKPLELAVSGFGTTITPTYTPWVAGTLDETYLSTFLVPVSGTFKAHGASTAATALITKGSVKITNDAEAEILSGSLTPNDVTLKGVSFEVGFTVRVSDFTLWRQILTGTDAGTAPAQVQYGSFEFVFKQNTNLTSTVQLKLEGARVAYEMELPEVEPEGGPVEFELSGIPLYDGTNAAVKATLVNTVASY